MHTKTHRQKFRSVGFLEIVFAELETYELVCKYDLFSGIVIQLGHI